MLSQTGGVASRYSAMMFISYFTSPECAYCTFNTHLYMIQKQRERDDTERTIERERGKRKEERGRAASRDVYIGTPSHSDETRS